jgi:hypothetical protein
LATVSILIVKCEMRYALGRDVDTERQVRTKMNRPGCHHILLRTLGLLLLFGGSGAFHLYGIEKHWIAHEAQVIVVGTFKPNPTYPWFDGWHLTGTINVNEVLYGPQMPHQIRFRLVCEWRTCQRWPPPSYPSGALVQGLWFLKRIDENTWESSLSNFDLGFRFLSDRGYWEAYIRKYKVQPWPGFKSTTSTY